MAQVFSFVPAPADIRQRDRLETASLHDRNTSLGKGRLPQPFAKAFVVLDRLDDCLETVSVRADEPLSRITPSATASKAPRLEMNRRPALEGG